MFNKKFSKNTTTNFDPIYYEFEKNRQKTEYKAKEREKQIKEKENQVNKIQINFKNEYVNEKTQKKYDEIIQNNNKKNQDKLLAKTNKENTESKNIFINEAEDTYQMTDKDGSKNTINITNQNEITVINRSELIFIEQLSTQKSKIDDTYIDNKEFANDLCSLEKTDANPLSDNTYVSNSNKYFNFSNEPNIDTEDYPKEYIDDHNLKKNNSSQNDNINNHFTESTLKYESQNEDKNKKSSINYPIFQNESHNNYNLIFDKNLTFIEKYKKTNSLLNKNPNDEIREQLFLPENQLNQFINKNFENENRNIYDKIIQFNGEKNNIDNISYKHEIGDNNELEPHLNDFIYSSKQEELLERHRVDSFENVNHQLIKDDIDLNHINQFDHKTEEREPYEGFVGNHKLKDFTFENNYDKNNAFGQNINPYCGNLNIQENMNYLTTHKKKENNRSFSNLEHDNNPNDYFQLTCDKYQSIKENEKKRENNRFSNYVRSINNIDDPKNIKINPYNKFLEDTLEQSINFDDFNIKEKIPHSAYKRDNTQQMLLNHMKSLIHNINDRKKETINLKTEKKKMIINNLENKKQQQKLIDFEVNNNEKNEHIDKNIKINLLSNHEDLKSNEVNYFSDILSGNNQNETDNSNDDDKGKLINYVINNTKDKFLNDQGKQINPNLMHDKSQFDKNEISKFFETKRSWKQTKSEAFHNTLVKENKEKEDVPSIIIGTNCGFSNRNSTNFINCESDQCPKLNYKFNTNINNQNLEKENNKIGEGESNEKDYVINNNKNAIENYLLKQKENNHNKNEENYGEDDFNRENIDEILNNTNDNLNENELSSIYESIKREEKYSNKFINNYDFNENKNINLLQDNKNEMNKLDHFVKSNKNISNMQNILRSCENQTIKNETNNKMNIDNYENDLILSQFSISNKNDKDRNYYQVNNNDFKNYSNPYFNKRAPSFNPVKICDDAYSNSTTKPIETVNNPNKKEMSLKDLNEDSNEMKNGLASSKEDLYKINPREDKSIRNPHYNIHDNNDIYIKNGKFLPLLNLDFKEFESPQVDNLIKDFIHKDNEQGIQYINSGKNLIINDEKENQENNFNKNNENIIEKKENHYISKIKNGKDKNETIDNYTCSKLNEGNKIVDFQIKNKTNNIEDEFDNRINRFNLDYDIVGCDIGKEAKIIQYDNLDLNNNEKKYQEGEDSNDLTKFKNEVIEFGNYKDEQEYKKKLQILENRKNKKLEEIKQRQKSRSKSNPRKYKNNHDEEDDKGENPHNFRIDNSEINKKNDISSIDKSKDNSNIERNKSFGFKKNLKKNVQENNAININNFKKNLSKEDRNSKNNLNDDFQNIKENINYVIHKINSKDYKKNIQTHRTSIFATDSKGNIPINSRVRPNSKCLNRNSSKIADESSIKNKNESNSNIIDFSSEQMDENTRIPIKIVKDDLINTNKKIKNINYAKHSNKKIIKNAISTVCLAGESNRSYREKILEIIDKCPCENFIILFKGNIGRFDLKAVYTFNPQIKKIELLTCLNNSPISFTEDIITRYYKYDIIQKDFKLLGQTKEISFIIDAVAIN